MKFGTNLIVLAVAAAFVAVPAFVNGSGNAAPQPANKMAVAGHSDLISEPGVAVTILAGTMKTSNPTDAVITVSLECDILTSVTTVGDDDQSAFGEIRVWVEIDDDVVPVSSDDTDETAGQIVFCNRAHQQTTDGFDVNGDDEEEITTSLQTKSSHSFQWVALDMGSAVHDIVVKATLTQTATNQATSHAWIGKRVLTVDPTKLAVNVEI